MAWMFLLIGWLASIVLVVADVLRRDDIGGAGRAVWAMFVIGIPWLGVPNSVIVAGNATGQRMVAARAARTRCIGWIRYTTRESGELMPGTEALGDRKSTRVLILLILGIAFAGWLAPAGPARADDDVATAETTIAPDPGPSDPADGDEAEDDTGEGLGTAGVVLIVVVAVAVLLVFMAGRGSARSSTVTVTSAPPAPAPRPAGPTRQERLRSVYTRGRAILDRFDDREVERRRSAPRHLADDSRANLDRTLTEIYELEAEAATSSERSLLRSLAESVNGLDRAVDDVLGGDEAGALEGARARLDRSLESLAEHLGRA
jgi:hypothetical protein